MNLPPRVLVALVLTVIAGVVLGISAVVGDGDAEREETTEDTTTTSAVVEAPGVVPTSSSIEVQPDWVPKQSSRYSDRAPVVTVTTLDPTTTTEADDESDSDPD